MRTPKEYTNNLAKGIITDEMLLSCLYSSNKRAKNWRDKEREYRQYNRDRRYYNRYYYDKYDDVGKAKAKKEEYYEQKEIMLSVVKPICVHKEFIKYERIRIYDYQPAYKDIKRKDIVWENCFYDEDAGGEVWFADIEDKTKPVYHFYYFYDFSADRKCTFHSPITEKEALDSQLEIKEIDALETEGHDISDLIANQFVVKLVELIKTGAYTYVPTEQPAMSAVAKINQDSEEKEGDACETKR